ncbi:hypothetical protein BU15DRAFT_61318 [Melanogaster broomeanus]|nr:hypothetical protein BU15DRAFT_61318 [Melanogaster broomeanus]
MPLPMLQTVTFPVDARLLCQNAAKPERHWFKPRCGGGGAGFVECSMTLVPRTSRGDRRPSLNANVLQTVRASRDTRCSGRFLRGTEKSLPPYRFNRFHHREELAYARLWILPYRHRVMLPSVLVFDTCTSSSVNGAGAALQLDLGVLDMLSSCRDCASGKPGMKFFNACRLSPYKRGKDELRFDRRRELMRSEPDHADYQWSRFGLLQTCKPSRGERVPMRAAVSKTN